MSKEETTIETEAINEEKINLEEEQIVDEAINEEEVLEEAEVIEEEIIELTPEEVLLNLEAKLKETDEKYLLLQANYQNEKKYWDDSKLKAKELGISETFAKLEKPLIKLTKLSSNDEEFKKGIDMIINNTQLRLETLGLGIITGGNNE